MWVTGFMKCLLFRSYWVLTSQARIVIGKAKVLLIAN